MDPALKVILNAFNSFFETVNKANYKVYDAENTDWYLDNFKYNKEDNKIYFFTKGERTWQMKRN